MLTLFFRLLYHSMSWTYDLVASTVSVGRWQRWVLSAVDLLITERAEPDQQRQLRVLELGYGPGHLQAELHGRAILAFGLDESFQMARQAARRLRSRGGMPRLARGLAQALPYPSGAFNSVVATFPTPYIVDPHTLAEIQRVLVPGGRLVVLVGAWITGRSLADRFMALVFRITGEAPDENQDLGQVLEPYQQAGFQARIRFVEQPGSRLMFIVCGKSN